MDQLFETAAYAEEQSNAHLILHAHVAHRTVNALAAVTSIGLIGRKVLGNQKPLFASLLRGNAVAVLGGVALGAAMVEGRMQDKSPIEWQDRSWRLLNNKTQNEIDVASAGGAFSGAVLYGLGSKRTGLFVRTLGGAGIGSIVGIASYAAFKKLDEAGLLEDVKKQVKELRK
ncbi:UNVERIFIED_CONTAM: hypothetical protein HDU68_008359 [Siphonaria sp. JEL0065]|nr:hypothetical protein HDU68_008359 [Siphonaria sp. JEL0065]